VVRFLLAYLVLLTRGRSFLWKAQPFSETDFRVGVGVKAFKWTGHNTYMVMCDDSFLSFGGGCVCCPLCSRP
jgi:hypothetical protein